MYRTLHILRPNAALASAAMVCGFLSVASAQVPTAPAVPVAVEPAVRVVQPAELVLARASFRPRPELEATYTIYGSAPADSPLTGQRIRLSVAESGLRDVTLDNGQTTQRQGSATHDITINTGKFKTIAKLKAIVAEYFVHFLSGPLVLNQDLGKIGDAKYGGEVHFVAESPNVLRFDFVPSTASPENAIRFRRADVQGFVTLLKK